MKLDNGVVKVKFSNADSQSTIASDDTFLLQTNDDISKTIRGDKLKEAIRLTSGTNLSYGTGVNSNQLNLDSAIDNTTLNSGCSWNGNLIASNKLSDGSVSDTDHLTKIEWVNISNIAII